MDYSHRYRAYPSDEVAVGLEQQLDIHRQLYNHIKWDYENSPVDDRPSEYDQNNKLPEWKQRWSLFAELHSKAAQATVVASTATSRTFAKRKKKGTTLVGSNGNHLSIIEA